MEQIWGIRGVAAERYPLNRHCAVPGCDQLVSGAHHVFPRGMTKSDSYFVEIDGGIGKGKVVIPHAIGLCGSGTTGHHGDVEEHRAWIKLEHDKFVWYERQADDHWHKLGPLNPQPGSQDPKRKRVAAKGEARRRRVLVPVKVPQDEQEDGAGILEDLYEQVEAMFGHDPPRPKYYTIVDAFNMVLLNEGYGQESEG